MEYSVPGIFGFCFQDCSICFGGFQHGLICFYAHNNKITISIFSNEHGLFFA